MALLVKGSRTEKMDQQLLNAIAILAQDPGSIPGKPRLRHNNHSGYLMLLLSSVCTRYARAYGTHTYTYRPNVPV